MAVRDGSLTTVLFLRTHNAKGQEVSGYIDVGHRLLAGAMDRVFAEDVQLMPQQGDLSYHNWVTGLATATPSRNLEVYAVHCPTLA